MHIDLEELREKRRLEELEYERWKAYVLEHYTICHPKVEGYDNWKSLLYHRGHSPRKPVTVCQWCGRSADDPRVKLVTCRVCGCSFCQMHFFTHLFVNLQAGWD